MARPLGSFNRRLNLPSHPEDARIRKEPAAAALRTEMTPLGQVRASDLGMARRPGGGSHNHPGARRMAGQAMNIDLSPGYVSTDPGGYLDTPTGSGEPVLIYGGRVTQPMNADLGFRQVFSYQPLQGQAELRTS